ncbi:hypothetical protein [Corallincola spongiicola]|uniref:Uncharacterized protein n=1 Tax=Corallincola spongiicola TaxID=2520508 RepID=A0ABY1WV88_9GAMM|nr:hypothetical protein [Corallincola spongiicola]TAA48533.1 hypothetical protein EXY25_04750 [Corallincola spongiicola]
MNIVSGDFTGLASHMSNRNMPKESTAIEVSDGFLCHRRIRIPEDICHLSLISRDERRTHRQMMMSLVLALTVMGIPLAIYLAIFQKQVTVAAEIKTLRGEQFVILADGDEWLHLAGCCKEHKQTTQTKPVKSSHDSALSH